MKGAIYSQKLKSMQGAESFALDVRLYLTKQGSYLRTQKRRQVQSVQHPQEVEKLSGGKRKTELLIPKRERLTLTPISQLATTCGAAFSWRRPSGYAFST